MREFTSPIYQRQQNKKKEAWENSANIITDKNSDFRREVGEIADVISFATDFLDRHPGEKQKEVLCAINGDSPGQWSSEFHEVVLEIGMKGGKNWLLEIDAAYTMYFIECLRNPHEYFSRITKRLLPYTVDKSFDLINISVVGEDQARRAFFDSVKRALKLTIDPRTKENWFERYANLKLDFDLKKKEIEFPTRTNGAGGIRAMSFNSTASAPEGLHMLKFYADELSRADTKISYNEAAKLYELGLSNTSVSFPNRVGKVIGWAYPNDTDYDLTHERFEKSQSTEFIFGRRYTTFEFNPSITKDMLRDRYKADPVQAELRYECKKPISKFNFYQPHSDSIKDAISSSITNTVVYKPVYIQKIVQEKKYNFSSIEFLSIAGDRKERCFAIDSSITHDRFVIMGGYNETIDVRKMELFIGDTMEVIVTNKKPIIDTIIVIEPQDCFPIGYLEIGQILSQLLKAFPNIKSINSDHFQNEKLRAEILAKGIASNTYFFSRAVQMRLFMKLRWNVWNRNIEICNDVAPGHKVKIGSNQISLADLWVLEGEKLIKDGDRIDHPKDFSKDLQDVTAILNQDLLNLEVSNSCVYYGNIDLLEERKLLELAERYLDLRYPYDSEGELSKKEIREIMIKKLGMSETQIIKLEDFCKEEYGI